MWGLQQPGGWPALEGWPLVPGAGGTAAPPAASLALGCQQGEQGSRKRCLGSAFATHHAQHPAQRMRPAPGMPVSPAGSEQSTGALPLALLNSLSLDLNRLGSLEMGLCRSWGLPQPSKPAAAAAAASGGGTSMALPHPPASSSDLDCLLACAAALPPLQGQPGRAQQQQVDEQLAALVPQLLAAWSGGSCEAAPMPGRAPVARQPAAEAARGSCSPSNQQHNSALFAAGVRTVQADMLAEDIKQLNEARAFLALFPSPSVP